MTELSARAKKALAVLTEGGQFVCRLERNSHTGREQFAYRLLYKSGHVVPGVGLATFYEIQAGYLVQCSSTSVSTYYQLRKE